MDANQLQQLRAQLTNNQVMLDASVKAFLLDLVQALLDDSPARLAHFQASQAALDAYDKAHA